CAPYARAGRTDEAAASAARNPRRCVGSLRAAWGGRLGQQRRDQRDQAAHAALIGNCSRNSRSGSMTDGEVRYGRDGEIATVIFDRPAARNAMTWRMYEQLSEACAQMCREDGLRVAVFRGAGGKAFIAGTDIAQFRAFRGGEDGIAYEEKMEAILAGVEALPVPTLAVIEGFAIGGGLAIAAAGGLRFPAPRPRFGGPLARPPRHFPFVCHHAAPHRPPGWSR